MKCLLFWCEAEQINIIVQVQSIIRCVFMHNLIGELYGCLMME